MTIDEQRTCEGCVKWLHDECPYLQQAREGTQRRTDTACNEFEMETGVTTGKRGSQADMLVTLALTKAVELFHDDRQVPYIRVQKSDAIATLRLRSKESKVG